MVEHRFVGCGYPVYGHPRFQEKRDPGNEVGLQAGTFSSPEPPVPLSRLGPRAQPPAALGTRMRLGRKEKENVFACHPCIHREQRLLRTEN